MTRRLPRLGCLFVLVVLAVFAWRELRAWWIRETRMVCETTFKQILPSPDHKWTVVVDEEGCEGMMAFISYVSANVDLVTDRPIILQDIPIVTVDTIGYDYRRPRVVWLAPDVLQIRIPWSANFDLWVRNANGIRIDMRYDTSWIDEGKK